MPIVLPCRWLTPAQNWELFWLPSFSQEISFFFLTHVIQFEVEMTRLSKAHKNMAELPVCTNIRQNSSIFHPPPPLHFGFPLKLYLDFRGSMGSSGPAAPQTHTTKPSRLCHVTCTPQKFRCHLQSCKILSQAFKIHPMIKHEQLVIVSRFLS